MRLSPVALYAPWPEGSRRTWGFATPAVVLISYGLAIIPAIVPGAVAAFSAVLQGGSGAEAQAAAMTPAVMLPTLLLQFAAWGGLIVWWTAQFERRGLATLGLGRRLWLERYLRGLAVGAGCAVLLWLCATAVLAVFPAPEAAAEAALRDADLSRLFTPLALALLAGIAAVFLLQGAMEEVVFRGWMMSALAARWGAVAAVAGSSLVFMLVHAHVFTSGLAYGGVALFGLGATGLFFALYALWERSIWGPVAAHGAFNILVIAMPLAAAISAREDGDIGAAFAETMRRVTGQAGPDAVTLGPQNWVQGLAFLILSGVMIALIRERGVRTVDG
jgi:uncharacterized protein